MQNKDLMEVYNQFHSKGSTAWFSDGREERETIINMGEPWGQWVRVLEIGCGEGDLAAMLHHKGLKITAVDYSRIAIERAKKKNPGPAYIEIPYGDIETPFPVVIMQGVLEHLNDPFADLDKIISQIKPQMVITSSPCFLNPRGIVWMTLHALGAVMSKTDLHFLHPWQFEEFCQKHGYQLRHQACDWSWGNGPEMIKDLRQRIPLALNDGLLTYDTDRIEELLQFLERLWRHFNGYGATMVYRIDIP